MTTDAHLASPRRKTRAKAADTSQLGLFDVDVSTPGASAPPPPIASPRGAPFPAPPVEARRRPAADEGARLVTIDELPDYPAGLGEIVDRSIADLPQDLVWLTYKDIRKHFGISRATIARRLKGGLVPGVRIMNGRMLDDGSVRRFDRTQLKWLLLCVRFGKR